MSYGINKTRTSGVSEVKRLNLGDWAAVAEIIGTVAVVVSLLFVAYSVNRNTVVLQANMENFLYQLQDTEYGDLAGDPVLAKLIAKIRRGEEPTDDELIRYGAYLARRVTKWEIVFYRHLGGLINTSDWEDWNRGYEAIVAPDVPEEWWLEWRHAFGPEFANHLDSIISEN